MPPKSSKDAFVGAESDDSEKKHLEEDTVRTDFIIENVFSYLLAEHYDFEALSSKHSKETFVFDTMKETLNTFREGYGITVKNLCAEIDVNEQTVRPILLGVSNELFSEGISWSRITAFFVFVGELVTIHTSKEPHMSKSFVDMTLECFSTFVKENLESWVEDNDGWEGITTL